MKTVIPRDESMARVETGVVQFGGDWPGVFMRGDSAVGYSLYLDKVISECEMDPATRRWLIELSDLLGSCLEEKIAAQTKRESNASKS